MASTLRAVRLARGIQRVRAPAFANRQTGLINRSYATATTRPATDDKSAAHAEQGSEDLTTVGEDPNMNGNYPDPSQLSALPIKRQFRDPYADWWDKQDRRNFGEPVHEDNDILGVFSPEEYTHVTPGWGAVQLATFVTVFCAGLAVIYRYYPDRPSAPRTFEGGLEAELGGPGALRARSPEDGDGL